MLPSVGPGAVGEHVADGITFDGIAIISGQQITQGTIIGIVDSALYGTQRAGVVGMFLFAQDINGCLIAFMVNWLIPS